VLSNLLYQAEEEDQPEGHRPIAQGGDPCPVRRATRKWTPTT
jgi:hypothetical protein